MEHKRGHTGTSLGGSEPVASEHANSGNEKSAAGSEEARLLTHFGFRLSRRFRRKRRSRSPTAAPNPAARVTTPTRSMSPWISELFTARERRPSGFRHASARLELRCQTALH